MINTAGLKGKVVFINFWASWCPPCRAEFPSIQEFYDQYKSNPDMVFLTVNLDDDPELGKVYMKQKNFTLPFVIPQVIFQPHISVDLFPLPLYLIKRKGSASSSGAGRLQ